MNPWLLELIVVRGGSHQVTERRSLMRDVEKGLIERIRRGVYVERAAFDSMSAAEQHVVRMRAFAAVAAKPPVFSHWSAAVALGLPFLGPNRLARVHVTVERPEERGQQQVAGHVAPVFSGERVRVGDLVVTTRARTAVDIARARPFVEGVVVVDAVLRARESRETVGASVALAAALRGATRAGQVLAFGRAAAESVLESVSRVTQMRLGIPPLNLQQPIFDREGFVARLDFWDDRVRSGGEADGEQKIRDAGMAPDGPAEAVIVEKRREDRVRAVINRLARWGWVDAFSPSRLGPILAAAGILPSSPCAILSDYCAP